MYLNNAGLLNYKKLLADVNSEKHRAFLAYLDSLTHINEYQFEKFSRNQQMAYLINAYNALTIKLVIDHYPVKSIKKIGSFFSSPWKKKFFSLLGGRIQTLDQIEHDFLRARYKDCRIHATVNCASISCPPLRRQAYNAQHLDQQLDEQMCLWLSDTSRNRFDSKNQIAYLSKIFDWYKSDFESWGGGLEKVLKRHAGETMSDFFASHYQIVFLDYSWDLNAS